MTADTSNAIAKPGASPTSVLRTLVLCDLVDSTALVERLGDRRAADLFRKHDRLARALIQQHGGKEIDKTDGFLLIFERPIQAVAFALAYQRELADLGRQEDAALAARIGVHVGDIVVWDNEAGDIERGAKPVEVEGLVKPVAARLMGLALPRQILLSGTAYDIAHRAQGELGEALARVRWRTHGRYRFKGVPDLVPVFEVGEEGFAPLRAPSWTGKAHREMPVWRRPVAIGFELVALALLIAAPIWYLTRPAPAIAFAQRDWVVVGDLKNLTGQKVFDDSLQTAFRIGLEQSRYVNTLSDLKARQTIKLMQRDPATTPIDRSVGAEIAIRDGARALVLPTIAEIGGRVRVTAEVVDPVTQTTVYSESADGVGEQSVLSSLDAVNRQLRVRLGEALATVSETSQPLEKVTTKSLDALKMYSLATRQMADARIPDAMGFFNEALKVDPAFATVHLQLGRLMLSMGKTDEALKELQLSLATPGRLARRDILLAEAHVASIESPASSLEKWKILAATYPDYTIGTGSFAYLSWQIANRYDDGIVSGARASASPQNPLRGPALHLLGILNLGNERYNEAIDSFKQAEAQGFGFKPYHAAALAVRHDLDGAADLLPPLPQAFGANAVLGTMHELLRVSLPFAKGDQAAATAAMEAARRIEGAPQAFLRALQFTDLALMPSEADSTRKRTAEALSRMRVEAASGSTEDRRNKAGHDLLLGWLSARAGSPVQAAAILADLEKEPDLDDSPVLSSLRALVKAQAAIADGRPADAASMLKTLLDGSELCLVHVTLLDAYLRAGDDGRALEHARWLAAHPGRAYAEYNLDKALMPFNVAQARLAQLTAAELSLKLGDRETARRGLEAFERGWREDGASPDILARIRKLQGLLSP